MPNILNALGLQTSSRDELRTALVTAFQNIYGADVNLESSTPDGQLLNIFVQSVLDLEDLLTQIYNSMDPDNAIGVVLDQRVAINGIQRQAGTFTVTPITVVTSQSVNLYGLDQDAQEIYTVSDNVGNRWELMATALGTGPGTVVLNFRAATPGENLTIPNTITVPVTIVLGVTSVNNPTSYTTLGINEESDEDLKIRRQKSVSLASQGYLAGLLAALENINGVTSAFVYENTGSSTDIDGIPGHSIWVIVSGTGANASIAQAIYTKRNAGCGMKGSTTYTITQVDGSPFIVAWDTVIVRNLFIAFTATSIDGVVAPNVQVIRDGIAAQFVPQVNQEVNINGLATLVQTIDPNCLVTNAGFSTGVLQTLTLSGVAASGVFKVNYNGAVSANINWNDSISTIQSKVQAVTGLTLATVTGSIASQTLIFSLSALADVAGFITVSDNTLVTSAPVAISFSYNEHYANTLTAPTKQNQFVVSAANIVITPMQLLPTTTQVAASGSVQFAAHGGYGAFTYSISINNSGGSINATSGLYTAGASNNVIDTVKAVDTFGDTITSLVTVV